MNMRPWFGVLPAEASEPTTVANKRVDSRIAAEDLRHRMLDALHLSSNESPCAASVIAEDLRSVSSLGMKPFGTCTNR